MTSKGLRYFLCLSLVHRLPLKMNVHPQELTRALQRRREADEKLGKQNHLEFPPWRRNKRVDVSGCRVGVRLPAV